MSNMADQGTEYTDDEVSLHKDHMVTVHQVSG